YGEVDNLFRLYTVDYDARAYDAYKTKLDTLKILIDSIANIPMENNPMTSVVSDLSLSHSYALEFAELRKDIDQLVFYAVDSIVNRILQDTSLVTEIQDTVVHKKRGLLQRIFNARNDTLVNTIQQETLSHKQIDVVHKNIEHYIETSNRIYRQNLSGLREVM